ncbi:MAG: acyl carrier protein [Alphaproteobacteria bacterium]|nr:acyl carrier protein [Alphaproteobacteria bacterium]
MPKSEHARIMQVIIAELQKVNEENLPLNETTDITTDLHVDSLAVMELVFALEEHFDVSIPLNELGDVRTIGQIAQLVETKRLGNAA